MCHWFSAGLPAPAAPNQGPEARSAAVHSHFIYRLCARRPLGIAVLVQVEAVTNQLVGLVSLLSLVFFQT